MSYMISPPGLSYVAPGARTITKRLAPPPASDVTPTAPGSNYMSYGPGVRDQSKYMFNALPYLEGNSPQASYDVARSGLGDVTVQASPAGPSTGPPRAIDVTVSQPSQWPQMLALALAAVVVYREISKRTVMDF